MAENRRVQFVVSGPFLLLLLLSAGSMATGFYLYTHRPPPPKPVTPPYYVNRTVTAARPCFQCIGVDGKLKASTEWKIGKTTEIPAGEQWWFSSVENPAVPIAIDGVPLLPVHPAKDNSKPWEGFEQRRVMLVVFQDVDGKFALEHPAPPTPPPAAESSSPPPAVPTTAQQP